MAHPGRLRLYGSGFGLVCRRQSSPVASLHYQVVHTISRRLSGEQTECAVRHLHWIFGREQQSLCEDILSRAGRPIARVCETGVLCHIDVLLAIFLEGPTCSFDAARAYSRRQEGTFLSKRVLPQMVPFGLTKSGHVEAAAEWNRSHDIPQVEATVMTSI